MRSLNLDHLRAFADVLELGSFSAAAERAGISQPAVSLQVKQLEQRLGLRLIERVGKRARPTAAGAELLAHIGRIDEAVGAALDAMAFHSTGAVGRVRLGTGATACIHLLPPVLRALRAKFPSLEIAVSTGNSADILKALEANRIDVAFVTLPAAGRMFDVTPVVDDELVAVFPKKDKSIPAAVTPALLAERAVVVYEPGAGTRHLFDNWFERAGVSIKPVMELGSVEAIKKLVGAGLGCGLLPKMATGSGDRAEIVVRPLTPRLHRKLGIVLRRDKPLTRGLREVVAALKRLGRTR
jgi:DNA-binding transcriptional LysR family regulator